MNDLQKEMIEVLEDTKDFYSEDTNRRAVAEGNVCYYEVVLGCDTRQCAVGRKLDAQDIVKLKTRLMLKGTSPSDIKPHVKSEVFHRLPIGFWNDLQYFHDNDPFWKYGIGLTKEGNEHFQDMKKNILENRYQF